MSTPLFLAALASVLLTEDPAAKAAERKTPLAARIILKNVP